MWVQRRCSTVAAWAVGSTPWGSSLTGKVRGHYSHTRLPLLHPRPRPPRPPAGPGPCPAWTCLRWGCQDPVPHPASSSVPHSGCAPYLSVRETHREATRFCQGSVVPEHCGPWDFGSTVWPQRWKPLGPSGSQKSDSRGPRPALGSHCRPGAPARSGGLAGTGRLLEQRVSARRPPWAEESFRSDTRQVSDLACYSPAIWSFPRLPKPSTEPLVLNCHAAQRVPER